MPTDTAWLQDHRFLDPGRCRRCGSENVRQLGTAHSLLDWLICNECWHVWGIPEVAAAETASVRVVRAGGPSAAEWNGARASSPFAAVGSAGRALRARIGELLTQMLRGTGRALCLMLASASLLQAQTAQAQTAQAATPQAQTPQPAAQGRVFASDAGMVLNFVKPDKTADFEAIVAKLREALQKSDKPERKQQASGWKVMRAKEPGPNGSVLYVFLIDPPAKGADYTVSTILAEAFPQDVQALYKQYADCYATGQNFVNFTLVSALGQ